MQLPRHCLRSSLMGTCSALRRLPAARLDVPHAVLLNEPAGPIDVACTPSRRPMFDELGVVECLQHEVFQTKQAEHHRKWAKKRLPIIPNSAKTSQRHAAGLDQTCGTSRRPILDEIGVIERLGMKRAQKSLKLTLELDHEILVNERRWPKQISLQRLPTPNAESRAE